MIRHEFLDGITKYWWLPLVTGLLCIALGVWTMLSPAQALPVIAAAFAYVLLAIGIFDACWGLATSKYNPSWGWDLCLGVLDIIAGVWMLSMDPAQMTLTFLYIVGFWMIFAAFNGIGQLFSVSLFNPLLTILGVLVLGIVLFFSFWLIANPIGLGITAWIWVGIALICYGAFRVGMSFRIKNYRNHLS